MREYSTFLWTDKILRDRMEVKRKKNDAEIHKGGKLDL